MFLKKYSIIWTKFFYSNIIVIKSVFLSDYQVAIFILFAVFK